MKFTTIDLELDQPSNEIIQIGAACFDTDRGKEPYDTFCVFPDIGKPINWDHPLRGAKCTLGELIPWGQAHYDYFKIPKKKAFEQFYNWFKNNKAGKKWVQWGTGDIRLLCEQSPISLNIQKHHVFNLKDTYKYVVQPAMKAPKAHYLEAPMDYFGLGWPTNGPNWLGYPHDATADAIATGMVFVEILEIINKYRQIQECVRND